MTKRQRVEAFREAREEYHRIIPYAPEQRDEYLAIWERMKTTAAPQHVGNGAEVSYMSDQVACCCGWKSEKYWDGLEFAWEDWIRHVAGEFGLLEQACACGKTYVPADGGKACHKLVET